jgi:hypothetical protein
MLHESLAGIARIVDEVEVLKNTLGKITATDRLYSDLRI